MKVEGLNSYWVLLVCSFTTYYLLSTNYSFSAGPDPWTRFGIEKVDGKQYAPEFTMYALDGKKVVSLKDLRGKVVFINFWATWCQTCKDEMPSIETIHKRFRAKGLEVLAVDIQEGQGQVQRFVEKGGYTFTVLLDPDGLVARLYKAIYIPITYIIDRNGKIVGKALGPREWDNGEAFGLMEGVLRQ